MTPRANNPDDLFHHCRSRNFRLSPVTACSTMLTPAWERSTKTMRSLFFDHQQAEAWNNTKT
jgi:hypothetical protein